MLSSRAGRQLQVWLIDFAETTKMPGVTDLAMLVASTMLMCRLARRSPLPGSGGPPRLS